MFGTNNFLFALRSCLTLLIGLSLLLYSINVSQRGEYEKVFHFPIFVASVVMLLLALLGLLCSFCNTDKLVIVFVVFMFLWTVCLVVCASLYIFLTNINGNGKAFRLEEANSLQKGFFGHNNWQRLKARFIKADICNATKNVVVDPIRNPMEVKYS